MNFDAFDTTFSLGEYAAESVRRIKYYLRSSGGIGKFFAAIGTFSILMFFGVALGFSIYGFMAYSETGEQVALLVSILFGFFFAVGLALALHAFMRLAQASLRMKQFAAQNKLTFLPYVALRENQGPAFSVQTRRIARNGVAGVVGTNNFWLFEYRFISGTGRHPYPNIFTAFMIELENDLSSMLIYNKKGRLKMIRPPKNMKKVSPWPSLKNMISVYSETANSSSTTRSVWSEQTMLELLAIYPRAEVQIWGSTVTIFLPGIIQPDTRQAKGLFELIKRLS
jgi:hypothetical protein